MPELSSTVGSGFANYFEKLGVEAAQVGRPPLRRTILEKSISLRQQRRPSGPASDRQSQLLHRRQIAGTGYVRDRDREFAETRRPSKAEVLADFDKRHSAWSLAPSAINPRKTGAPNIPADGVTCENRFAIVLDCAAHADHHIGQIINLSRELVALRSARELHSRPAYLGHSAACPRDGYQSGKARPLRSLRTGWLCQRSHRRYVSSLNRDDANRYKRRHTNRLINTTTTAMINVAASNTSNCPPSLARLIVLPSPGAETIFP